MRMREGFYEFEGNLIKYEDGIAYDIDAGEEIPVILVCYAGFFLCCLTEGRKRYGF